MTALARPVVRDAALAVALFALSLAVRLALASALGVATPVGSDPAIWALSARAWWHDGQLDLPPLYPALVALLAATGTSVPSAAQGVTRVLGALVPVAVFGGARVLHVDRRVAVVAGVATALAPDLLVESLTVQPESLVALLFAVAAVGALAHGTGERWGLPTLAAAVAALGLAREHGLALLLPAAAFAAFAAPKGRRLVALAVVLGAAQLAPVLLGVSPLRLPGTWPWAEKATVVAKDLALLRAGHLPSYLQATNDAYPTGREALLTALRCAYTPDVARAVGLNLARAVVLCGDLHVLLLLAAVAVWRATRRDARAAAWALPALALCLAPSFLVWSQRRHASVFIPVALLGLAYAVGGPSALSRRARVALLTLAAVAKLGSLGVVREAPGWLSAQAASRREEARLGAVLARDGVTAIATPRPFVAGPAGIVALYAGVPFVDGDVNAQSPGAWGPTVALLAPLHEDPPAGAWRPVGATAALEAWRPVSTAVATAPAHAPQTAWFPVERGVRPLTPLTTPACSGAPPAR